MNWRKFGLREVRPYLGQPQPILVARADGRVYAGRLVELDREYAILANGNHRQVIPFHGVRCQFTVIDMPQFVHVPELADKRLI